MRRILILAMIALGGTASSRADLLTIINGDRYHGGIQLVNEKEVHLKSEILGLVKIPREKVVAIQFGNVAVPVAAPVHAAPSPGAGGGEKLSFDPKAIEQVRQEFLGTATPEANAMFGEMLRGLSTGAISVEDIRSQARDTLKQLKELQAELGEEGDNPLLSTYGAILERFVRAGPQSTNAPSASKIKPPQLKLDEE